MENITIRAATAADMRRRISIMYDDRPADMRAIEPDRRKAQAIGALVLRAGVEIAVAHTVVALLHGRAVGWLETKRPGNRADGASALATVGVVARGVPTIGLPGLVRYLRYLPARAKVRRRTGNPGRVPLVKELA